MLPIKYIIENLDHVKHCVQEKGTEINFDQILELDRIRKIQVGKADELKGERNRFSKQIGILKALN